MQAYNKPHIHASLREMAVTRANEFIFNASFNASLLVGLSCCCRCCAALRCTLYDIILSYYIVAYMQSHCLFLRSHSGIAAEVVFSYYSFLGFQINIILYMDNINTIFSSIRSFTLHVQYLVSFFRVTIHSNQYWKLFLIHFATLNTWIYARSRLYLWVCVCVSVLFSFTSIFLFICSLLCDLVTVNLFVLCECALFVRIAIIFCVCSKTNALCTFV